MEEESLKYIYLQHAGASQRGLGSSLPAGGRWGAPRALSPPWCWGIIPISPRAELGGCPFGAFLIYFFQKSQVGWKGERWCCSDSAPPGWFGVFLGEGGCCSAALVVLTQLLIA